MSLVNVGDLYIDCAYMLKLCTAINHRTDTLYGIPLATTPSVPTTCSISSCGVTVVPREEIPVIVSLTQSLYRRHGISFVFSLDDMKWFTGRNTSGRDALLYFLSEERFKQPILSYVKYAPAIIREIDSSCSYGIADEYVKLITKMGKLLKKELERESK